MTRRADALAFAGALAGMLGMASAQAASSTAGPSASVPLSTGVNLDFTIAIDKFIFFRIGDSPWPATGGTTSTVSFVLTPSIPGGPTTPVAGNNTSVNWSGAAPSFSVTPSNNALPVEVRSNGGQITLRATATSPLASGANTIPLSEITIASSDTNLPAPPTLRPRDRVLGLALGLARGLTLSGPRPRPLVGEPEHAPRHHRRSRPRRFRPRGGSRGRAGPGAVAIASTSP